MIIITIGVSFFYHVNSHYEHQRDQRFNIKCRLRDYSTMRLAMTIRDEEKKIKVK